MIPYVTVLLFGAVIGSFLNVCIYRLPREESVAWPASHCPSCRQAIAFYDNIPIVSYLLLRGRCRACHAPIRNYIKQGRLRGQKAMGRWFIAEEDMTDFFNSLQ